MKQGGTAGISIYSLSLGLTSKGVGPGTGFLFAADAAKAVVFSMR